MSLSVLQLTTKDMMRARAMLKEQAGLPDTDPYDIIDPTGDPDLRRTLVIWCVQSRANPALTWEEAWELPLEVMFPEEEGSEGGEAPSPDIPSTPGPQKDSGSGSNGDGGSSKKQRAAEAVPS